nr:hypothetical protein [uncultured Carboxylicivirga sp.]
MSKVNSDLLVSGSDLYWTILLNTLYVFILIPFIFIAYLGINQIPDNLEIYHFSGEYSAENIIKYIESFENRFAKKYTNFKKSIEKCGKDSKAEIENYSEAIDNNLFCIKLNGGKRLQVFWDCSDWFLKTLLLSLPIVGIILVVISYLYFSLTGLILSIVSLLIIIPVYLILLSSMLSFFRYILRIIHREQPALSVAKFALESITNFNVKRAFDNKKREYFYYSTIHKYNNQVNADAFQRRDYIDPNPFTINGVIDDYEVQE